MANSDGFNPRLCFAYKAQTIAMKAKLHEMVEGHKVELLTEYLRLIPDHEPARIAVLAFIQGCKTDKLAAAEALYEFLPKLCPGMDPRQPERTLAKIEAERRVEQQREFDWQTRADLR